MEEGEAAGTMEAEEEDGEGEGEEAAELATAFLGEGGGSGWGSWRSEGHGLRRLVCGGYGYQGPV